MRVLFGLFVKAFGLSDSERLIILLFGGGINIRKIDPNGFDLRGTIALDHEHKIFSGIVFNQVAFWIPFNHLLECLLVYNKSRASLYEQTESVVDELINLISLCLIRRVMDVL